MKTYPTGVLQNLTAGNIGAPDFRPVVPENWRMFSTEADADAAFALIDPLLWNATLYVATSGMYAQYAYINPASDVRCRLVAGGAKDADGFMFVQEYPSDIFDRNTDPLEGIDTYVAGEPHVLKVRRITETLGQIFWDAA